MTKDVYFMTKKKLMSRHSSLLLEGFIIVTEVFVSRHKITIKAEYVS